MGGSASPAPAVTTPSGPKVTGLTTDQAVRADPRRRKAIGQIAPIYPSSILSGVLG